MIVFKVSGPPVEILRSHGYLQSIRNPPQKNSAFRLRKFAGSEDASGYKMDEAQAGTRSTDSPGRGSLPDRLTIPHARGCLPRFGCGISENYVLANNIPLFCPTHLHIFVSW